MEIPAGGGDGSSEGEWKLINTVETTEQVTNILINTDSEGNAFECNEIFIVTTNLIVTAANTNYVQLNNNNAYQFGAYGFFATAVNNSGRKIYAKAMDNLGAYEIQMLPADGTAKKAIVSNTAGWAGIVNTPWKIRAVQLKSTFASGGEILLYGR